MKDIMQSQKTRHN